MSNRNSAGSGSRWTKLKNRVLRRDPNRAARADSSIENLENARQGVEPRNQRIAENMRARQELQDQQEKEREREREREREKERLERERLERERLERERLEREKAEKYQQGYDDRGSGPPGPGPHEGAFTR
ncbi:hypothetical protein H2199_001424 [Coniosporium tulheliwenetii]|uniref:Uncharacterized protein n=1 Tax=Coniosporium tulheliwenetii TaxID=3383036 RepID=A0ACC2ZLY7_9PEZI|nr:hypothetical protein H2199_001424 [Cladosporium sp. JES 115]